MLFVVVLGDFVFIIEVRKPSQDHDTKLLDEITDRALMDGGNGDVFRGALYDDTTTRADHFSLKFRLVVFNEEGISYIDPQIHVLLSFEVDSEQAVLRMVIVVRAEDLRLAINLVLPPPTIEHDA